MAAQHLCKIKFRLAIQVIRFVAMKAAPQMFEKRILRVTAITNQVSYQGELARHLRCDKFDKFRLSRCCRFVRRHWFYKHEVSHFVSTFSRLIFRGSFGTPVSRGNGKLGFCFGQFLLCYNQETLLFLLVDFKPFLRLTPLPPVVRAKSIQYTTKQHIASNIKTKPRISQWFMLMKVISDLSH